MQIFCSKNDTRISQLFMALSRMDGIYLQRRAQATKSRHPPKLRLCRLGTPSNRTSVNSISLSYELSSSISGTFHHNIYLKGFSRHLLDVSQAELELFGAESTWLSRATGDDIMTLNLLYASPQYVQLGSVSRSTACVRRFLDRGEAHMYVKVSADV